MSSYQRKAPWDRNNKYWCEYCRIYVYDNRTSRKQHDSGTKHKDNVEKYLRKIGKDAEAKVQAEKKLDAQLAKIDEAAARSYQQDIGASATDHTSTANATRDLQAGTARKPQVVQKPARAEQAEGKEQSSRPADVGIIGEWEVVEEADDLPNDAAGPEAAIANAGDPSQTPMELRGAELLDEEDRHSHKLAEFEIKEKTTATAESDQVDDGDGSAATVLFKKRRAPVNRATRKQRKI
ncbi:hypothetical protein H4S02_002482 [Coemansia sp. RSA 2611]|nr:hypothetical protein H4S01_004837 [Coemansia sp. RSA 2610]KAJ2389205.1 hypothetical protein H4S02_002482 [Coemansia sp. RSA 2611]